MGKKKVSNSFLGRAIIKDRFGGRRINGDSMLHTSDLDDGFDWTRLNLRSVTQETAIDEFLSTAELAGTEFAAEKLNIKFINPGVGQGLPTIEERKKIELAQMENRDLLSIPRRPSWNSTTKPEELIQKERDSFYEWRQQLAELQEKEGLILTPFEKNLEFWRQLWRVTERSDVVVQIVDARKPLMFRCEDLEKYVKENDENKQNLLLVNKADFLTEEQRVIWAEYFTSIHLPAIFFSAIEKEDETILETDGEDEEQTEETDESGDESDLSVDPDKDVDEAEIDSNNILKGAEKEYNSTSLQPSNFHKESEFSRENLHLDFQEAGLDNSIFSSGKILSRVELINFFKTIHTGKKVKEGITTIGLVGYPNVGKSSTINAILQAKKVSVSATPGKTKHFQTLFVDNELQLCDCPGLVFPNFVSSKAEMLASGILSIDEMKDHVPAINFVAEHIPRNYIQYHYGILLPAPMEGEDLERPPTAEEFVTAYGYMRGFMTQRGTPDLPRSARYILKDYVNGKLLFCHAPPGVSQDSFHEFIVPAVTTRKMTPQQERITKAGIYSGIDVDRAFFVQRDAQAHSKGVQGVSGYTRRAGFTMQHAVSTSVEGIHVLGRGGDGKKVKKHKKKEKLRRVYSGLDN